MITEEKLQAYNDWLFRKSAYDMALSIIMTDKMTVAPSGGVVVPSAFSHAFVASALVSGQSLIVILFIGLFLLSCRRMAENQVSVSVINASMSTVPRRAFSRSTQESALKRCMLDTICLCSVPLRSKVPSGLPSWVISSTAGSCE